MEMGKEGGESMSEEEEANMCKTRGKEGNW